MFDLITTSEKKQSRSQKREQKPMQEDLTSTQTRRSDPMVVEAEGQASRKEEGDDMISTG